MSAVKPRNDPGWVERRKQPGPVEAFPWPEELAARVVDGPSLRVHGYDVVEDLVAHYSFAETMLLTLTGEAPTASTGALFEAALGVALPVAPGDAPSHVGVLARLCGATPSATVATGTITLAEWAASEIAARKSLFAWLDARASESNATKAANEPSESNEPHAPRVLADAGPARVSTDAPVAAWSVSPTEARASRALVARAATLGVTLPFADVDVDRTTRVLTVFHLVGLRTDEQKLAALVCATLPSVAAESFAWRPGQFTDYPMNFPAFDYDGGDAHDEEGGTS